MKGQITKFHVSLLKGRRIITLCNANSWHFNSHFGWWFVLTRRSLFIRHKAPPCFTQLPFFMKFSRVTAENFTEKNIYFIFLRLRYASFWLFKLFMETQLCREISLDNLLVHLERSPELLSRHCQWTDEGSAIIHYDHCGKPNKMLRIIHEKLFFCFYFIEEILFLNFFGKIAHGKCLEEVHENNHKKSFQMFSLFV